jgi:hypothetical protein
MVYPDRKEEMLMVYTGRKEEMLVVLSKEGRRDTNGYIERERRRGEKKCCRL